MTHTEDSSHHTSSAVLEYVWIILGALALTFVLRTFVFNVFTVPTGSMLNTIQEGDLLVGEKVTLLWDQPKRGDVVTFRSPADEETLLDKQWIYATVPYMLTARSLMNRIRKASQARLSRLNPVQKLPTIPILFLTDVSLLWEIIAPILLTLAFLDPFL